MVPNFLFIYIFSSSLDNIIYSKLFSLYYHM